MGGELSFDYAAFDYAQAAAEVRKLHKVIEHEIRQGG